MLIENGGSRGFLESGEAYRERRSLEGRRPFLSELSEVAVGSPIRGCCAQSSALPWRTAFSRCASCLRRHDSILRFLSFSALHLLNYVGNISIFFYIASHASLAHIDIGPSLIWYATLLGIAHLSVALYCAVLAWCDEEIRIISLKYCGVLGHFLVSILLGFTQLIQLKIAFAKYTRRVVVLEDSDSDSDSEDEVSVMPRRWRRDAERAARLQNAIPWTFPSKGFESLCEGTVFASVTLHILLVMDYGTDPQLSLLFSKTHHPWFNFALQTTGCLSFMTIAIAILNFDYHLSPAIRKCIDHSISYTFLHGVFRLTEAGSRIIILVFWTVAFDRCDPFWKLFPIIIITVDFLSGMVSMLMLEPTAEERHYIRLHPTSGRIKSWVAATLVGLVLLLTNVTEFVDEAERHTLILSARRFSKRLRIVRMLTHAFIIVFLFGNVVCTSGIDWGDVSISLIAHFWKGHKVICISFFCASVTYYLALALRFHRVALSLSANFAVHWIARYLQLPVDFHRIEDETTSTSHPTSRNNSRPREVVGGFAARLNESITELSSIVCEMRRFPEWTKDMETEWRRIDDLVSAEQAAAHLMGLVASTCRALTHPEIEASNAEWDELVICFATRLRFVRSGPNHSLSDSSPESLPTMSEQRTVSVDVLNRNTDLNTLTNLNLESHSWYYHARQGFKRAPGLTFLLLSRGVPGSIADLLLMPIGKEDAVLPNDLVEEDRRVRMSDFDLLERLGEGTFAAVFKSQKKTSGELYAMKFLLKRNYRVPTGGVADVMPRRERDTLCAVGRHPNVAALEWAFETNQIWILVLELCDLGSLTDHLRLQGRPGLDEAAAARLGGHILAGLNYLHSHCILHRDVKPGNIGISRSSGCVIAKLLDFGCAKRAKQSNTILGSLGYGAPELVRASKIFGYMQRGNVLFDERIDIYAFGVVLFVMLVGREATQYDGEVWNHDQFREMLWDSGSLLWSCSRYQKLGICGTSVLPRLWESGAQQTISALTEAEVERRTRTAVIAGSLPLFEKHANCIPQHWLSHGHMRERADSSVARSDVTELSVRTVPALEKATDAVAHALNIAFSVTSEEAELMLRRHGYRFQAQASQIASWLEVTDALPYDSGESVLMQLGERMQHSDNLYFASLLTFKECLKRRMPEAFPEVVHQEKEVPKVGESLIEVATVFLGNLGKGKSTLANCLAGEVLFMSGAAAGIGVTSCVEERGNINGIFIDTPGLAGRGIDISRARAADISQIMKRGGAYRIIFVITEEMSRIHEEDKITMKVVLDAVKEIEEYGIIINRCEASLTRKSQDLAWKREFEANLLANLPRPSLHIFYCSRVEDLIYAENKIIDLPDLRNFIEKVPIVKLRPGIADEIDVAHILSPHENQLPQQTLEETKKHQDQVEVMNKLKQERLNEKSISERLGIQLAWILNEFPDAPELWGKDITKMTFRDMAPLVAYGDHGYGKGLRCPRDGEDDCSIVDAVRNKGHSSRATVFLSWVWEYDWETVQSSLQRWCEGSHISQAECFIWWCFYVNNQYRNLGDYSIHTAERLVEVFGQQLPQIGKMLAMMNKVKGSKYIKRIWCVYELFVARDHEIPIEVILPAAASTELDKLVNRGLAAINNAISVSVFQAKATSPDDERAIKDLITRRSSFDEVNREASKALRKTLIDLLAYPEQQRSCWGVRSSTVHNYRSSALTPLQAIHSQVEENEATRTPFPFAGGDVIINVPRSLIQNGYSFAAELVSNLSERERALAGCGGDVCSAVYEMFPKGVVFEPPVIVRLKPVSPHSDSHCGCHSETSDAARPCLANIRMLKRQRLDADCEIEVLDCFVDEDGYVCATLYSFCYLFLNCCYPFVSAQLRMTETGFNGVVKLHNGWDKGLPKCDHSSVGESPDSQCHSMIVPQGPTPIPLTNGRQYRLTFSLDETEVEREFTWLHQHGFAQISMTFSLDRSDVVPNFKILLDGVWIFYGACDLATAIQGESTTSFPSRLCCCCCPQDHSSTITDRRDQISRQSGRPTQDSILTMATDSNIERKMRELQQIMNSHQLKPYTCEEVHTLAAVVRDLVEKPQRYKRFGGMTWLFLRDQSCGQLLNWTDSLPLQSIDRKSLLSHWSSTDTDAHDAAGIFGCHYGQNKLLSVGAILRCDLVQIASFIDEADRNRTGFTSALYAAVKSDCVVLKVSETRAIKLFCKDRRGIVAPVSLQPKDVGPKLLSLLRR